MSAPSVPRLARKLCLSSQILAVSFGCTWLTGGGRWVGRGVYVCEGGREMFGRHGKPQKTTANKYLDHLISNTAFLHKHSPTVEWNLYKNSEMSPYQSAVLNVVVFPAVKALDSHSPQSSLLLLHQRVNPKWLQMYLVITDTSSGISLPYMAST